MVCTFPTVLSPILDSSLRSPEHPRLCTLPCWAEELRTKLKLTPHRLSLASLFLAYVRSLVNKMDEIRLRITHSKRLLDCNVMVLMETWLHSGIPNNATELAGRYTLQADRMADDSSKTRGGGLCIYVKKKLGE